MQKKSNTNTKNAATNNYPYGISPEEREEREWRRNESGDLQEREIVLLEVIHMPNTPEWLADAIFDAWEYTEFEDAPGCVTYVLNALIPSRRIFSQKSFTGAVTRWLVSQEEIKDSGESVGQAYLAECMYGFSVTREMFRETMKKIREGANRRQAERDAEKLTA